MKKLLISGFEPFDNEIINPSWEALAHLGGEINGYSLTKIRLPVVFGEAAQKLIDVARDLSPDVILCIGQAGGRAAITPELIGINLRYARIPDNRGNQPKDEPITAGGETAYFSSLPVRKMSEAIAEAGVPSNVSYSAGAYVCNDVLYTLLSHFKGSKTRVGFIHIPYCTEQGKENAMSIDDIVKGLNAAIESLDAE